MPGSAFWHTAEHDKTLRKLKTPDEREPNLFLDLYKDLTGRECPKKSEQPASKPEERKSGDTKPKELCQSVKEAAKKFEEFMWKRS